MKRWITVFTLGSLAFAAVMTAIVWMYDSVDPTGLGRHGITAMIIGLVLTIGLGVGLMALVFYSARSGTDFDTTIDTHPRR